MPVTKKRVPDHMRRVLLYGRVLPSSLHYLESMGEPNYGRAVDKLIMAHKAIMRAMKPEKRAEIERESLQARI